MEEMSTAELQIAERARKFKEEPLTNLSQFITPQMLYKEFMRLNKYSSAGTDGQDWFNYVGIAEERLPELLSEYKSGRYKAPPIRRVYIPKGKTDKRPLGIPTIEDKVLQSAVRRVMEPIYEEIFKDFSYGFRPNRSCHKAIAYMFQQVSFGGMRYIIDADIQNYFGSINHGQLREFLDRRVKDGKIRKMLDKWLKAGILEDETLSYPEEGTPQGGIVSPLLSNIYLHYVLDEWFSEVIQPRLKGRSFIVRYADDFVLGFERAEDANRVMAVLFKRFEKYFLRLHPGKTRLVNLNRPERGNRSFDFLGFTHYMGKSRKGKFVLKRKTSKKKYSEGLNKMGEWLKCNRHNKIRDIIRDLNVKLRGYYNYYGITFNSRRLAGYFHEVKAFLPGH
ncbi:group II intron reverse transcriptase/maturase [Anaerophaga thermohalophila]|uniref:group II intron reverse transcriptase/maturase n=1 Tax=Anaerophaga thermohalophila TaxID=177400 RepID=UPI0002EE8A4C|nr:group II intron reverse transcriptase/maturase [Anaerophaga thermohalophila]